MGLNSGRDAKVYDMQFASCSERQISISRNRHRTILCLALLIVAASFVLRRSETQGIALVWPQIELPPICASRALLGIECPGCGLTRSFVALAAGDLQESWRLHRLGWLLALAIVGQIPYRLYSLRQLRKNETTRQGVWQTSFCSFLIAALILNWLLKISGL
jgi:Protein of unknown function (DUF2752)